MRQKCKCGFETTHTHWFVEHRQQCPSLRLENAALHGLGKWTIEKDESKETATMGFRFTAKVFEGCHSNTVIPYVMYMERAQAALDEYLKTCQVVYAKNQLEQDDQWIKVIPDGWKTFEARLFNVQKIEKVPCEHKRREMQTSDFGNCMDCGVRLTATWKAEGE